MMMIIIINIIIIIFIIIIIISYRNDTKIIVTLINVSLEKIANLCHSLLVSPHSGISCQKNILRNELGIISSHAVTTSGCDALKSPWIIQAKAGQTAEIVLLDFKALYRQKTHSLAICSDMYGFIVERTLNINETICGQNTRETTIYRSKTNNVEVYLTKTMSDNFLLKYKGD